MQDFLCIAILRFFADLGDPQADANGLYPLQEIILVALCAPICGANFFVEVAGFANANLVFMKRILPFKMESRYLQRSVCQT